MPQMRGRVLFGLMAAAITLAACNPQPVTVTPTTSINVATPAMPTTVSTATQSVTASDTPAPTDTSVVQPAQPTVTLAPTVIPPTNIPDTEQPTAEPTSPGIIVFNSKTLGISIHFARSDNGAEFAAREIGDKVYVYMKSTQPESGQWVQTYSKPSKTSLEDAIRMQVLQGYSLNDCLVKLVSDPNKGSGAAVLPGIQYAMITLPQSPDDDMAAIQAKAEKCPQPYAAVGGLAYFMATSAAPDRFVFFSIGQYMIPAEQNRPWQTTLKFSALSANAAVNVSSALYIDDRSHPERLIASLLNAINRKEYGRAYGYFQDPTKLSPYEQYVKGYATTESVQLWTGDPRGSAGAGQLYYTLPALLTARMTDGSTRTFAACYQIHLSNPGIQATPPFNPMSIQKAQVDPVNNGVNVASTLAQVCQKDGFPYETVAPPLSASAYFDDRSSPVQVLRSLFNAINRKEYARAYTYWEPGAKVASFDDFQNGYVNTVFVALQTGAVQSDAGAGQFHYSIPVTLKARANDGSNQTFVGCYFLHLANPELQSPPFNPLAITSATVKKVANNADTTLLMKSACPVN